MWEETLSTYINYELNDGMWDESKITEDIESGKLSKVNLKQHK